MRKLLFQTVLFLVPVFLSAQSTPLPLNFSSYAIKLCVTKDENLVLTTRMGEIGLADSVKANWRRADPKVKETYLKPLIDQGNFFNKDTGFVSGFIQGENSKYDIIYHTTNGGITWMQRNFGQSGWIDDAVNLDDGEAWLSVAGSGIAYTKDYGFTWQKFDIPEIKQRFSKIFFNNKQEGFIGSLWDYLAYTQDNCATWKIVPTPLDQKAYNKTNTSSRPEFNRVAILSDYFLVKQEELVFYSKKDSINWKCLKEYNDFYTDPSNSALFFKTTKGDIVRADSTLAPMHTYENIITGYDYKCRNGSLFIVSDDKMQQLDPHNQVVSVSFTTKRSSGLLPITIGYSRTGAIGVLNGKAYLQKDYNGKWDDLFVFPIPVDNGNLSMIENAVILYNRNDDSLFYFDLLGKEVARRSKSKMVQDFCNASISRLIFSVGSQGCFHSYSDHLTYTNENGSFGNQIEESSGTKHRELLPNNDVEIDESIVIDFVKAIPLFFDTANLASINDLAFSEMEYEQCKKDIIDFKASLGKNKKSKETKFTFYRNNLDYDRLLSLVDSVKYLDRKKLNESLFNLNTIWSTTTFWSEIQLVNSNNETLSITGIYYEPNSFYFPWHISLNGYSVVTTNIKINRFLQKVYPRFLSETDRMKVLHALVKNLY
jgi:hypothetical protein